MSKINKILICIVLFLATINVVTIMYFSKKISDNKTQQKAIENPTVEQKPVIKYIKTRVFVPKHTTSYIDLTDEQRAEYQKQISDINAVADSLYNELYQREETIIDCGSVVKPEVPLVKPPEPVQKRFIAGGILYPENYTLSVGYKPFKQVDFYGVLGYNKTSKLGVGGLVRF